MRRKPSIVSPDNATIVAVLLGCGVSLLCGCGTTIYNLKIPLGGDPVAGIAGASRVVIDDERPPKDRVTHLGKDIWSCERWFGDDTFQPSRLVYLQRRVEDRSPVGAEVQIRLTRFDVVEYCEQAANENSASAADSVPGFSPAPAMGDTVVLRLAGEINGMSFDVSRQFDYGNLHRFPRLPSSHPMYRALLTSRLDAAIDEVVGKVWRAGFSAH